MKRVAACAWLVLVGGCASENRESHAEPGSTADAAVVSPTPDASVVETPDAAVPDAAVVIMDAAMPPDAAMLPDAGQLADAAVATPDAGVVVVTDAGPQGLGPRCFGDIFDPAHPGPNYDQYNPVVGSHCKGTNHQNITGIERVVFLGDSVTVGTPPTVSADFYRARLADRLAAQFNLQAPGYLWKTANYLSGVASERFSGDFASCAKWGARTDDLYQDNSQVADCFPMAERNKHTLVIMTMGGNDVAALQKDGVHRPYEESYQQVADFVARLRETMHHLKDPTEFPGGVEVVFGNMYEFTDATGDVGSCAAASVGGFTAPWDRPQDLERLMIWGNEQYMQVAVETQTDMIFMLESFCGHGYHNQDASGRCYRGPNAPRWFDLSCIHPNPEGHGVIADMMMDVVME